jgi:hypothetical protein
MGNSGFDRKNAQFRTALDRDENYNGDMKGMTKGRSDDLGKGRAQSTGLICSTIRLSLQVDLMGTGEMAEFMNHGTLLCY